MTLPADGNLIGPNLGEGARIRQIETVEQIAMMGPMPHPFGNKLNDQHITDLIANDREHDKRDFSLHIIRLIWTMGFVIVVLAFVVLFCWLFSSDKDLIEKVLIAVVSFAGGAGAGVVGPKVLGKE